LLQTKQGCEEILLRWEHLAKQLERNHGVWDEADWKMALNLLGVAKDRRDDSLPDSSYYNLEWIAEQMAQLERLQAEVLEARDDRERIAAQAGCPLSVHADIKNQRRYESTCHFRMRWAKTQLDLSKSKPIAVETAAEILPEVKPEPTPPAPVSEPPAPPAATEVKKPAPTPTAKPFQRQTSQAAERRKKKQQRKAESKARRQQQKRARRR
jgi:hypothetical protein